MVKHRFNVLILFQVLFTLIQLGGSNFARFNFSLLWIMLMASSSDLMDLEDWVIDSNQALNIKFISSGLNESGKGKGKGKQSQPFNQGLSFKPLFTYTVFGDEEKIFG